ncbi:MAG: alanine--tRNA ligase [Candidatus Marsarchaeota archaeon]|nr:alanine--tRNA ligase [Candidatus Marsarchaeota archaeon]
MKAEQITAEEIKKKYFEFFKEKGHRIIKSESLIPEHDPTVLFTTAGMHPLVPFILGQPHPMGKRIADAQKCVRTGDIESVGDATHLTFFEMLGNWSFGDYFKKEAIEWSFEFLTNEKWLGIPIEKLAVTCFEGNSDAPRDEESAEIWMKLGIPAERIRFLPKEDNFWGPAGQTGPCGPCSEMFYWKGENNPKEFNTNDRKWVEIWNDVFMEYNKTKEGKYEMLKQKNVDTGMGLERITAMLQGKKSIYDTELFKPILEKIKSMAEKYEERSARIIADHLKAATFILGDDKKVEPSNVEQGYILRRLIRRAIRHGREIGIKENFTAETAKKVIEIYEKDYEELNKNQKFILSQLDEEENRFKKVISEGLKAAEAVFSEKTPIPAEKYIKLMQSPSHEQIIEGVWTKKKQGENYEVKEAGITENEIDKAAITGKEGFLLYQSYGFPEELIIEIAREKKLLFHRAEFAKELEKHQETSRVGAEKKFKSGLADKSEQTTKLHTATHLLNEALRRVVDKNIKQKGSNITPERLRFDFNFNRKLTPEEIKKVEDEVNGIIKKGLNVKRTEMTVEEAKKLGAQALFTEKYGERVSVYNVSGYSIEVCTGPHVKNTSELGVFKIVKEEAVSAGVRRIKAILT